MAAAAALGVTAMVMALVEERINQRIKSVERRLRYLEDNVVWSGDNKGLSVERKTTDLGRNGLNNFHAGWRNGRCKRSS